MNNAHAILLKVATGELGLMEATADLGFQDAGYTLQAMAKAGLTPYQLPDIITQELAIAGLEPLRAALKPRRGVTAYITTQDGVLTATFPWGVEVSGSLEDVAESLHTCAVKPDDITMPPKDAADSPTTGQRIAIYAALKKTVWIGEHQLIDRADFVSARELAGIVTKEQLAAWKDEGVIFALDHGGIDIYPRYGFDTAPPRAPLPALKGIIEALDMDAWHVAIWFMSGCGMLGSERPMDVIRSDPEAVLEAAIDEGRGITHG